MSTSLSDALGGSPAEKPVETPEPVEVQDAAAPVEAEAAPEAVAEPEQPKAEPKPEPHMVPVSVVKELRDELRSLKAQMTPQEPFPDVLDNPDGYNQRIQELVSNTVTNATFNMSRELMVDTYGEDAVAAAEASVQPGTPEYQSIVNSAHPYRALMRHVERQQAMAEIGEDPAAYRARIEAEVRAKVEAEMVSKQVKATPPSVSLAGQPNIGGRGGPSWAPTSLDDAVNRRR